MKSISFDLLIILVLCAAEEQPQYTAANGKNCYLCPPGFKLIEECPQDGTASDCDVCPHNTYMLDWNNERNCKLKSPCPTNQRILHHDPRNKTYVCGCNDGEYINSETNRCHSCPAVTKCPECPKDCHSSVACPICSASNCGDNSIKNQLECNCPECGSNSVAVAILSSFAVIEFFIILYLWMKFGKHCKNGEKVIKDKVLNGEKALILADDGGEENSNDQNLGMRWKVDEQAPTYERKQQSALEAKREMPVKKTSIQDNNDDGLPYIDDTVEKEVQGVFAEPATEVPQKAVPDDQKLKAITAVFEVLHKNGMSFDGILKQVLKLPDEELRNITQTATSDQVEVASRAFLQHNQFPIRSILENLENIDPNGRILANQVQAKMARSGYDIGEQERLPIPVAENNSVPERNEIRTGAHGQVATSIKQLSVSGASNIVSRIVYHAVVPDYQLTPAENALEEVSRIIVLKVTENYKNFLLQVYHLTSDQLNIIENDNENKTVADKLIAGFKLFRQSHRDKKVEDIIINLRKIPRMDIIEKIEKRMRHIQFPLNIPLEDEDESKRIFNIACRSLVRNIESLITHRLFIIHFHLDRINETDRISNEELVWKYLDKWIQKEGRNRATTEKLLQILVETDYNALFENVRHDVQHQQSSH